MSSVLGVNEKQNDQDNSAATNTNCEKTNDKVSGAQNRKIIALCLSKQGRKSQLWSRATHNGPRKMRRGVNEKQNDPQDNSAVKY